MEETILTFPVGEEMVMGRPPVGGHGVRSVGLRTTVQLPDFVMSFTQAVAESQSMTMARYVRDLIYNDFLLRGGVHDHK